MFRKRRTVTPHFRTPVPYNPFTGKFAQFGRETEVAGDGTGFRWSMNANTRYSGDPDIDVPVDTTRQLKMRGEIADGIWWDPLTEAGWHISETEECLVCDTEGIYFVSLNFEFYPRKLYSGNVECQRLRGVTEKTICRDWVILPEIKASSDFMGMSCYGAREFLAGDKMFVRFEHDEDESGSALADPRIGGSTITALWVNSAIWGD
jgi:hypothetical protein